MDPTSTLANWRFIHAADIHLDSPLRGLVDYDGAPIDDIRRATRDAFVQLIDLCIQENVQFLLLAGDLYDGDWKDYNTGLFFLSQIGRLSQHKIRTFIVHGNHDAQSRMTKVLSLPESVHVFSSKHAETIEVPELNLAIHGQSYPQREVSNNLVDNYPPPLPGKLNLGMLHTALEGRPGHAPYAPCKLGQLVAKGYDYWALGHVHQRSIEHRHPWVVFPGNLQGRHIRECGAKGASIVIVDDGQVEGIEHRSLDVVRWSNLSIDCNGLGSPDEIVQRCKHALLNELNQSEERLLAVRIRIYGSTSAHFEFNTDRSRWLNEIRSIHLELPGQVWIESIQFQTTAPLDREQLLQRQDAIGSLLREIARLRQEPHDLSPFLEDFRLLRNKLPQEYYGSDGAINFDDPEQLLHFLDDVERQLTVIMIAEDISE